MFCLLFFSARMEQMKLRHLEEFPARTPNIPPPQGLLTHNTQKSTQFHTIQNEFHIIHGVCKIWDKSGIEIFLFAGIDTVI